MHLVDKRPSIFASGRDNVTNFKRSGLRSAWMTGVNTERVEEIARTDGNMCNTAAYGIWPWSFYRTVQHIMVDALEDPKVCDRWVPRVLRDKTKSKKDGFRQLLTILCSA